MAGGGFGENEVFARNYFLFIPEIVGLHAGKNLDTGGDAVLEGGRGEAAGV